MNNLTEQFDATNATIRDLGKKIKSIQTDIRYHQHKLSPKQIENRNKKILELTRQQMELIKQSDLLRHQIRNAKQQSGVFYKKTA